MQISVSIDSDRTRNGQPPQILGAIGHPRYNGISELTDFVITGRHCISQVRLRLYARVFHTELLLKQLQTEMDDVIHVRRMG